MKFNEDKFELLRYGSNKTPLTNTKYLAPGGREIQPKQCVRDLGVIMNDSLTFANHVDKVCADAKKYTGLLMRTFNTRDPYIMKTLWTSIIQLRIDYCSQLWSPYKAGDILKLENLPRSFTCKITNIASLPPWERMKALHMQFIQRIHERYKILYTWKVIKGIAPDIGITTYISTRHGRVCHIPKLKNQSRCAIQTLRENSLHVKGPQLFNLMPAEVRNLTGCTLGTFKKHLDKFMGTIPDQPRLNGYTNLCAAENNSITQMLKLKLPAHC